jgi:hypothetical protein
MPLETQFENCFAGDPAALDRLLLQQTFEPHDLGFDASVTGPQMVFLTAIGCHAGATTAIRSAFRGVPGVYVFA